jgi:purine-nucleoside phosphorylase
MPSILQQLNETTSFIKNQYSGAVTVGIVLGSGLGNLINEIRIEKEIPYDSIPHFPVTTVDGHSGKLIFGQLSGKTVVAMAGRFHYYEGYSAAEIVYPIRLMKQLGIQNLLISNAAGGVNKNFKVGDLMVIKDHISLFTVNPLLGHNEKVVGPRFPDMSEPYKTLIAKAQIIAKQKRIVLQEGIYCGVTGPSFETRAEYKLVQQIGCDAVGMSTVQEVIAAAHMGLPVFAISIIADIGIREEENAITHEEVLQAAKAAEPQLSIIFKEMVAVL